MTERTFLDFQIERQKMLIAKYNREMDDQLIIPFQKLGEEIAIVVADFKCQSCGSPNELQIHHLITRIAMEFLPTHRYMSQRYYWADMVLLCRYCHRKLHHIYDDKDEKSPVTCISQERINEIKERHGVKSETKET
jgi:5-methylcytosine-specific restriction endonuclease McrA